MGRKENYIAELESEIVSIEKEMEEYCSDSRSSKRKHESLCDSYGYSWNNVPFLILSQKNTNERIESNNRKIEGMRKRIREIKKELIELDP